MPHGTAVLLGDVRQQVDEALKRVSITNNIGRWAAWAATRTIARALVLLGSAIIFAAAALDGQLPQPWFAAVGDGIAASVTGSVAAAAAAFAACRFAMSASLSWIVAAAWLAATFVCSLGFLGSGPDVGMIVALVEGAVLAAACLTLARGQPPAILHYLLSAMLVVFGSVHIVWNEAISQLLPELVPLRSAWPWVTGALQLAAGFASISVTLARIMFPLVAAMFLAWIPLVHLPRILADPSTGELGFAAMAVALAGCLILAAGRLGLPSRPALQPQ